MKNKLNVKPTEFLSAFFPDEMETIRLRTFKAKGDSKNISPKKQLSSRYVLENNRYSLAELENINRNSGIYFVVNSGGNEDKDITRYNAFFVENDELSIEEQHKALSNAPLQPSIRIETKRSIHAHWLPKDDCSEADWRDIQERLINYFDGDKQNKNPSRCMRLPQFNHVSLNGNSYQYKKVEVVDFQPERRFTVEEMKTAFPASQNDSTRDCDNVTTSNNIYETWEELNAELGKKIMQGGKLNKRGRYEMRCPVHRGKTETSLFYYPDNGAIKCLAGCLHSELLKGFGLPEKPSKTSEHKEEKKSQADLLAVLAEEIELFVSQDDEVYATVPVNSHFETCAVESKAFKNWLGKRYYEIHKKTPNTKSIEEALGMLEGEARYGCDTHKKQVFTRIAEYDKAIYLDLANDKWEAVKITADGWEVSSDCPVKFRRTKGMKSLPIPEKGGSFDELNEFLNIHDDDLILVKAWLIACLKPKMPYPVLILNGEQGSAKTTAAQVLCELIDPNEASLRSEPRDERDLAIAATNRLIVAFDNLSGIKNWLSDALCRIATGGGFATRKLHTDSEEKIFNFQNPILLNGISDLATRSDLLDRSIVAYLPIIEVRKPQSEFWKNFKKAQPKILGAILDALSEALRNFDNVQLEDYPRMADFTKLATAAKEALGLTDDEFVKIYKQNRDNASNIAVESSLISPAIFKLVEKSDEWMGEAQDIKAILDSITDPITQRNQYYPKTPLKIANDLRRLAPDFRRLGINVDIRQAGEKGIREGGTGKRIIKISKLDSNLSHCHNSSQNNQSSKEETLNEGWLF